jgi:capsular exopolysaccharide synthesis family protein
MDMNKQTPLASQQVVEPFHLLNLMIRFKNAFMQMWPLLVAVSILLGGLSWYRQKNAFVPLYQTKAIFTVDTGYTPEDIFGTGAYYDQYAARQLAASFPRVISTEMMRDRVVQELEKGYINGQASAYAVADSNMLVLTVTGNNPKDIYDYLCAIIKCYPQVAISMVEHPQIKIVTSPTIPTKPYNRFDGVAVAVKGAMLGAVFCMIFFMVCALLTRTIQTTEELKQAVNLPILIALPKVEVKKRRSGTSGLINAENDPNMMESMRGLRMKLKKMLRDTEKKVILVTSTLAGEGKTTIAVNVAAALGRDGHSVLLLDADLHSQSVARSLGEETDHNGLMECMKDDSVSVFSCIRHNEEQNLDFISGRSTDRRHYTLNINKINALLDELRTQYEYIVIDTPPNDVVSDAMALCRCATNILYVVRQDYVQRNQVINSMVSMHGKGINISGCIFNGVPRFQRQYGYGYRSGYGYGYDYGNRKYHYGMKYSYGNKYGYGYQGYRGSYSAYLPSKKKRKKGAEK